MVGRYSVTLERIRLQSYVVLFGKNMQVKWVPVFWQFRLGSVLSDDWEEGLVTQGLIYQ